MSDELHCMCAYLWDLDKVAENRLRVRVFCAPTWLKNVEDMLHDLKINTSRHAAGTLYIRRAECVARFINHFVDGDAWPRLRSAAAAYAAAYRATRRGNVANPDARARQIAATQAVYGAWYRNKGTT